MKQIVLFDGSVYPIPDHVYQQTLDAIRTATGLIQFGDDLINKSAIMKIADAPKIPTWDGYSLKKERDGRFYFMRGGQKMYLDAYEEKEIVYIEEKKEGNTKQLVSDDNLLALAQKYGLSKD
jgi:hypothetical protein